MKKTLRFLAIISITFIALPNLSFADVVGCKCYCGKFLRAPCGDEDCKRACGWQEPSAPSSAPSYDYEAERQRQEAERQRQLEAERQRQRELEEQRQREEEAAKQRQIEFEKNKQEALDSMKGIGDSELGLKDAVTDEYGLKGIDDTGTGGHTALDEAHTNQGVTLKGLDSETPEGRTTGRNEDASGGARKVFDNAVPLQSSGIKPAVDLRNVGKAPKWPSYVSKDKRIQKMQKERDAFLATQQKKDAELAQLRKEIETEKDPAKKSELMVEAAKVKEESSKAEYKAALADKNIQKRAQLLIDTHVANPPDQKDQKTKDKEPEQ